MFQSSVPLLSPFCLAPSLRSARYLRSATFDVALPGCNVPSAVSRCAALRRAFVAPFLSPAKRGTSLLFSRSSRMATASRDSPWCPVVASRARRLRNPTGRKSASRRRTSPPPGRVATDLGGTPISSPRPYSTREDARIFNALRRMGKVINNDQSRLGAGN